MGLEAVLSSRSRKPLKPKSSLLRLSRIKKQHGDRYEVAFIWDLICHGPPLNLSRI